MYMKNITYLLFFVVLFFTIFFLWRMVFFPVSSSLSYVVVPKNAEAVSMIDGVAGTLSAFPEKTFFAKKVANRYESILVEEGFSSQKDIIKQWNRRINADLESHMITLQAFGYTNHSAEQLVRASANTLESYRNVYYGESISLDLIANPITESHSLWIGFWVSVLGAFVGSGIVYLFLERGMREESLPKKLPLKKEEPYYRAYEEWARENEGEEEIEKQDDDKKEERDEENTKNFSRETQENEAVSTKAPSLEEKQDFSPQKPIAVPSNGSANVPVNLPIAEIQQEKKEVPKDIPMVDVSEEEPTNEEYKKRLNELLGGKMISLL